jgi:hypothetical protein
VLAAAAAAAAACALFVLLLCTRLVHESHAISPNLMQTPYADNTTGAAAGSSGIGAGLPPSSGLAELRELLVAAKAEQDALRAERDQVAVLVR